MAIRVAINGFGRIGRNVLRAIIEQNRTDIQVVAINDLGPVETNAHLLRYDSIHGKFAGTVKVDGDTIDAGAGPITVLAIRDPKQLPWAEMDIDIALECTGIFTARDKAQFHLDAGAKRVLISAPGANADITIVYGVNDDLITGEHKVISNGSCTTNCLAPLAKVLNDAVGITKGFMTTIHSYTGDQPTLDTMHKDLYRARAAAMSMIPTSTGAAKALGLVLPELAGKLDGASVRVPTPNVSVVDLSFISGRPTSVDEINQIAKQAAGGKLAGIFSYDEEPKVSIDFNHDPHSSSFAAAQTKVIGDDFVHVMSWYDNEWGFSCRMVDVAAKIAQTL
ncbi:NADPH-dependent glyceraldehyde-3-phosphate dehydrogenase / NAD-dependent glyceraldehyde-3-phosphate dehydrogenase [hydrothermal vent metagenome]|uniref:NADPH-dependent glyceraldehyde-3-phosphate dehydrogenase / NAD-dependent glyceraldehyde-3-phosphate dehydrogenase n=1 Tax=hydrothermal vent metagenome TaxID=652676 RepID=A0A3B0TI19_9ZZZZ